MSCRYVEKLKLHVVTTVTSLSWASVLNTSTYRHDIHDWAQTILADQKGSGRLT